MSLRLFKTLTGLFFAFTLGAVHLPDPAVDTDRSAIKGKQTAVLAGGCFWCTEAVFELFAGVEKVVSGYSGGDAKTAHYEIVGSGATDHAESIEITFDPAKITYGQILKIFFSVAHDPTQLNRQGPDYGRQYRSAIFYNSPEQQHIAEAYIQQLGEAKVFKSRIVTQVVPLNAFYPAEGYHQDYVKHNPANPYVVANSVPKIKKAKEEFPTMLKN
jgi:peptide-methionine (S)-S-oxide reductase